MTMNCVELATKIETLQPKANPRDVARLCLLLINSVEKPEFLLEEDFLRSVWKEAGLKLQAATDQHAAMTAELETLAKSDPQQFSPDQIWILIRAIKVQSQILQLYLGNSPIDV
ncbi:MAG: hypothetical protein MPJ24_01790 [Pirellulaceae bacterium]|nr:hypothetical protein [Pirellulaceae bacterium]